MSEALAALITSFIGIQLLLKIPAFVQTALASDTWACRTDLDTMCNVRNSVVYDNLGDIGKMAVPAVDEQLSLFLKH